MKEGLRLIDPKYKREALYARHDPSVDVEGLLGYSVPVSMVPRRHLFGIQTQEEYERVKRKRIRLDHMEDPKWLTHHPILACAIPATRVTEPNQLREIAEGGTYNLAITDGHHRTRYAPAGTREMHARILTVAEAVRTMPNLAHAVGGASEDEQLLNAYAHLGAWMRDTLHSFVDKTGRSDLIPYRSMLQHAPTGGYIITPSQL